MDGQRAVVIGRLEAERRAAVSFGQDDRAAELKTQIERLSAEGSAVNPARETTAATRPRPTSRRKTSGQLAADRR